MLITTPSIGGVIALLSGQLKIVQNCDGQHNLLGAADGRETYDGG